MKNIQFVRQVHAGTHSTILKGWTSDGEEGEQAVEGDVGMVNFFFHAFTTLTVNG